MIWLISGLAVGLLIGLIFGVFLGFSVFTRAGTWD